MKQQPLIPRRLICVSASLACWLAATLDAAVIDVKSIGPAKSGLIRLSDIADIDAADPQLQRQLAAVTLGPAPAAGRKMRITQQTIRQRLLAQGINLTDIEFTGQSVVLIESPAEAKTAPQPKSPAPAAKPVAVRPFAIGPSQRKKAEQVVQDAFHRQYKSAGSNVGALKLILEISDRDVPVLMSVDPEIVRFVEDGLEWGGPQALTAQFPSGEGATQIVRVQAWLNETPQVISLKHVVLKGQVIKDSDLVKISTKAGETGIQEVHAVIGQEAARTLHPGKPLQPGDTIRVPLIRNNDVVTVKFHTPGLKVTRLFRAHGSGAAGEIVNCSALDDPREKLPVRVTGWHEAEIVSPENDAGETP